MSQNNTIQNFQFSLTVCTFFLTFPQCSFFSQHISAFCLKFFHTSICHPVIKKPKMALYPTPAVDLFLVKKFVPPELPSFNRIVLKRMEMDTFRSRTYPFSDLTFCFGLFNQIFQLTSKKEKMLWVCR